MSYNVVESGDIIQATAIYLYEVLVFNHDGAIVLADLDDANYSHNYWYSDVSAA
jgi:hypothetical protein